MVMLWSLCLALAQSEEPVEPVEPVEPETPREAPVDAVPEAPVEDDKDRRRALADARVMERLRRSLAQRTLNNHPFVRPQFVRSALPASHLGSQIGAGVVLFPTEGGTGLYGAGVAAISGGVRAGKWVGIDASVGGVAGVAASQAEDALDLGAAASWSWRAGAVLRVVQARSTALSVRAGGRGRNGTQLSLRPGLEVVAAQVQAQEGIDLVEASRYMVMPSWDAGGAVHVALAQAMGRHVGLQAAVGGGATASGASFYDGQEQTTRATVAEADAGVALSFDANPVPLAVQLEYRVNLATGLGDAAGATALSHNAGLGLYMNGWTNTFGLELGASVAPQATQLNARLGYRAYF